MYQEVSKTGASANEWSNAVSGVVGGKVGGKGATSQGVGQDVAKVDEAIALAERWMREKLHL